MVDKANRVEELEQKYRMFFENMGEGVCILDENMVITLVNDNLCKTTGYSRAELLGKKVTSFFEGVNKKIIKRE